MSELPRKTIEELVTLYTTEPKVADVFTEGECDRDILEWFVKSVFGSSVNIGVYPIDSVELSDQLLRKQGLTRSNRSEVIALCTELHSQCGHGFLGATGVVDRDLRGLVEEMWACPFVLVTDHACMEGYYCCEQALQKLISVNLRRIKKSAGDILAEIVPLATEMFLLRAASISLGLGWHWQDGLAFVDSTEPLSYRRNDHVRAYLGLNQAMARQPTIESEVERLRSQLMGNGLVYFNGHDLINLISKCCKRYYSKAHDLDRLKPHVLVQALLCSLDTERLRQAPMFQSLSTRLRAALAQ